MSDRVKEQPLTLKGYYKSKKTRSGQDEQLSTRAGSFTLEGLVTHIGWKSDHQDEDATGVWTVAGTHDRCLPPKVSEASAAVRDGRGCVVVEWMIRGDT